MDIMDAMDLTFNPKKSNRFFPLIDQTFFWTQSKKWRDRPGCDALIVVGCGGMSLSCPHCPPRLTRTPHTAHRTPHTALQKTNPLQNLILHRWFPGGFI